MSSAQRKKPHSRKWWHRLRDADPITLNPLSSLRIPPFSLKVEDSEVIHYFDSQALANYLLSTGTFVNPITRLEISREDCIRLDDHLRRYGMKELAKCLQMLDLQNSVRVLGSTQVEESTLRLRREAGVIASHLLQYPSLSEERRRPQVLSQGFQIIDDDEQLFLPLEVEDDFPGLPIVRRQASEADFPPIITSTISRPTFWVNSEVNSSSNLPERVKQDEEMKSRRDLHRFSLAETKADEEIENTSLILSPNCFCPYFPKFLKLGKIHGRAWLATIENKLEKFLEIGSFKRTLTFEPMNEYKRKFLQEYCQRYWGLSCRQLDPEPKRFCLVSLLPFSFRPQTLLSEWIDSPSPLLENDYICHHLYSTGILLSGCSRKVSNALIRESLRKLEIKESEYDISSFDDVDVTEKCFLLEFSSSERGRKVLKLFKDGFFSLASKKAEWWPCGVDWAKFQINTLVKP